MQSQSPGADVTVVVPVYNGAGFVLGLIEALRAQSARPARILFVDDGSSDGSANIIRGLGHEIVFNDRNLGLYGSISNVLRLITTEYTALIFQDDLPAPHYLAGLGAVARQYPEAAFLWSGIDVIGDEAKRRVGSDTGRVEVIRPGVDRWRSVLRRGTFWTISGSFSRTERLREYPFRSDLPHCADFDFLLRAIREQTFVYYERPLMSIRLHEAQSSSANLRRAIDISERLAVIRNHLRVHAEDTTMLLRFRLFLDAIKSIALRSAGAVRRRRLATALAAVCTLPSAVRLLKP